MKFIFLLGCIALSSVVFSQAAGTGTGSGSTVQRRMDVYSWAARPEEDEKVSIQQLFQDQQWSPGVVYFKSGRAPMAVPLIFDLFNNTLYYRQGNIIMEFVDTVSHFTIDIQLKKDTLRYDFISQQPAFQANSAETFYELLVDGPIKLLKCKAKSISLIKDRDLSEEKRKELKELYFASLPGNKITLVYLNADLLKEKLPEYSTVISDILKKEHIKLKNEQKLAELFVHLNNGIH